MWTIILCTPHWAVGQHLGGCQAADVGMTRDGAECRDDNVGTSEQTVDRVAVTCVTSDGGQVVVLDSKPGGVSNQCPHCVACIQGLLHQGLSCTARGPQNGKRCL